MSDTVEYRRCLFWGGKVWDAWVHATEHAHLVAAALFDPGNFTENSAHSVIAVGLVWTTLAALVIPAQTL